MENEHFTVNYYWQKDTYKEQWTTKKTEVRFMSWELRKDLAKKRTLRAAGDLFMG
jgi:hypothetical protein